MKIAYFDPFAGAAGDMIVAALIDAGAPLEAVQRAVAGTGLGGVRLDAEKVRRGALAATRFLVHTAKHGAAHGHGPEQAHHRGLDDILALLPDSDLPGRALERARAVFQRLAEAEARVHGVAVSQVHFHEVGAEDSIADIVGAVAALEALGIDEVRSGAPALGHDGFVDCAHGRLPVPVPAVVELMRGRAFRPGLPGAEMTTPTGAAILTALTSHFGPMPGMTLECAGNGAGSREDKRLPNVLRVMIGHTAGTSEAAVTEDLLEVSAVIDDLPGEIFGYLFEKLPAEGALEVSLLPCTLKKSRAGLRLTALVPAAKLGGVAAAIFRETSTLGLRYCPVSRIALERSIRETPTRWGTVRMKCGMLDGRLVTASPEYEDCRRIAAEHGVPLKEVQAEAALNFPRGGDA